MDRCTHSYNAAGDANSARVDAKGRMMTNVKRVTLCDRVRVTFRRSVDNLGHLSETLLGALRSFFSFHSHP